VSPTWDILTTSIPHRHDLLLALLEELGSQLDGVPQVRVIVYRDNLEKSYGDKTRDLLHASEAEYVSCIDDDDWVAPDFIARVTAALEELPDYVGYPVYWTRDGVPQRQIEHSLRHGRWSDEGGVLKRDISEKNPMRREIALLGNWYGGYAAEVNWANEVRATGKCVTEAWIDEPMYYYRECFSTGWHAPRQPFSGSLPELPSYPWLRYLW
jgi:hypothetical protein